MRPITSNKGRGSDSQKWDHDEFEKIASEPNEKKNEIYYSKNKQIEDRWTHDKFNNDRERPYQKQPSKRPDQALYKPKQKTHYQDSNDDPSSDISGGDKLSSYSDKHSDVSQKESQKRDYKRKEYKDGSNYKKKGSQNEYYVEKVKTPQHQYNQNSNYNLNYTEQLSNSKQQQYIVYDNNNKNSSQIDDFDQKQQYQQINNQNNKQQQQQFVDSQQYFSNKKQKDNQFKEQKKDLNYIQKDQNKQQQYQARDNQYQLQEQFDQHSHQKKQDIEVKNVNQINYIDDFDLKPILQCDIYADDDIALNLVLTNLQNFDTQVSQISKKIGLNQILTLCMKIIIIQKFMDKSLELDLEFKNMLEDYLQQYDQLQQQQEDLNKYKEIKI